MTYRQSLGNVLTTTTVSQAAVEQITREVQEENAQLAIAQGKVAAQDAKESGGQKLEDSGALR